MRDRSSFMGSLCSSSPGSFMNPSLRMGGERRGVPLSLDLVKCMECASETEYGLEITGSRSPDENTEENEENHTVESLTADIQKYEGLRKRFGNNIRDNGHKIDIKLKKLRKKLAEVQQQEAIGTSSLSKEAEHGPPKEGYELTDRRIPASVSCAHNQVTSCLGHEQGKGPAFNDTVDDFRNLRSNSSTKVGITKWSKDNITCRERQDRSSLSVPSSSFFASYPDFSQESRMGSDDGKFSTEIEGSIASNGASGKRHKTFSPLRNCKGSPFKTLSPSFPERLEKATVKEAEPSRKSRFMTETCKQKSFLGASLDTAMELSDDDDKKNADDLKADRDWKDMSNRPYSLRSNFFRKEGFKVTYPPSGDPEAVEVNQTDMKHLDPYEFLNDTVIDFYIKYLQRPAFLSQTKKADFHFFNTFFYKKLLLEKRKRRKGSAYYSELRKWTKGISIFEKKYLLVPVHDCAHWSLAIICFAKSRQERTLTPYILHLDSMKEGHESEEVFAILRRYLEAEWSHIRGLDESGTTGFHDFVCKRVEVPLQQNAWDCGLFVLYFIECFLRDADVFEPGLLDSMFGSRWFKPQEASNLRKHIRAILESLVQELNDEILMEDMD